jgi:hypothetical protein
VTLLIVGLVDATYVVVSVRRREKHNVQRLERELLRLHKHPNTLLWDTLRLAFQHAGIDTPPAWQDFTASLSSVARMSDVTEARLIRQMEIP